MPISAYYGGHGKKVMADMRKRYGARADEVFYATANKRNQNPDSDVKKSMKRVMDRKERSNA